MYDAIVVGARCAGSACAMLLARKGYKVLVVDRATMPSDTMSTHFVWQAGTARLHRWGLLDRVRASGCPPIRKLTLDFGDFALCGCAPPADPAAREHYCPRRSVLDKILIDAAGEAGAEVREAFSVRELVFDGDRVAGIRGVPRNGAACEERGRIVIGADGLHSLVAGAVQAPKTIERPIVSCCYYSYWSNLPTAEAELYFRPGRGIFAFPTNFGLTCVVVFAPIGEFPRYRDGIEAFHLAALDLAPSLGARARSAHREERFVGSAEFPNFLRRPYGPGWALVGDAGYHRDPYTAQGIGDAFCSAELLAAAIDDGFSSRRALDQALADYERRRNEAVMAEFESTCQRAALQPMPPEMAALLRGLRGNQEQIDRLLGTDAGTVAHSDFFSPENVGRILGAAC